MREFLWLETAAGLIQVGDGCHDTTAGESDATGEYGCNRGGNILSELHFFYDTQSRPAMAGFHGALYSYVHDPQGGRGYY